MTIPPTVADPAAADDPLADFSHCHAGITAQLQVLAGLPALLEPAARARQIARDRLVFFRDVIEEHHGAEERELFPAVLASAKRGAEREQVQVIVDRLVSEHRQIEAMWSRLKPALQEVAKGRDSALDAEAVQRLVDVYGGHAGFEEREFLPLSQRLLGRDSNHMAALGLALHMRHAVPELLGRIGHRI
jgi:hemerythrin-like domain-containing protein